MAYTTGRSVTIEGKDYYTLFNKAGLDRYYDWIVCWPTTWFGSLLLRWFTWWERRGFGNYLSREIRFWNAVSDLGIGRAVDLRVATALPRYYTVNWLWLPTRRLVQRYGTVFPGRVIDSAQAEKEYGRQYAARIYSERKTQG